MGVLGDSILELFPWLPQVGLFLGTAALIAVMAWFVRGSGKVGNGFVIDVDEEDIAFKGNFPPQMQALVIQFLREDVALPGKYQVRGHWEGQMLVIVVKGEQARGKEQLIRNFMKLNVKKPR